MYNTSSEAFSSLGNLGALYACDPSQAFPLSRLLSLMMRRVWLPQTAAELPRRGGNQAPHQRQSFEREQHRRAQPPQPEGSDSLAAPAKPAALKQRQPDLKKASKAAAAEAPAADSSEQQQGAQALRAAKPLKKQKRSASKDEPLRQNEAADVETVKQKKRKRPEQDSKGVHEQTAEEKAQSRLASFAKPTLAAPGSTSHPRKKKKQQAAEAVPAPEQPAGPQLTKAQRKNIWRAKRRAMQHKEQNAGHASQD